jgi:WD40 repeat protein
MGGEDGTIVSNSVTVVSLATGEMLQTWDMYDNVKISPNGTELIRLRDAQAFEIWDIKSGEKIREIELPLNGYSIFTHGPFQISPDGTKILFSYIPNDPATGNTQPATTIMLDVLDGKTLFTENSLMAFFTPEGSQFTSITNTSEAGKNLKVTVCDIQTGNVLRTFSINAPDASDFHLDPAGRYLFTTYSGGGGGGVDNTPSYIFFSHGYIMDGSVRQWDFQTGDFVWEYPIVSQGLIPSPDGTRIFTSSDALISWRIETPAQLIAWVCSNRYVAEFSPEQRERYRIETKESVCKSKN